MPGSRAALLRPEKPLVNFNILFVQPPQSTVPSAWAATPA